MKRPFPKSNPAVVTVLTLQLAFAVALNSDANDATKTIIVKPATYKARPISEQSKSGKALFSQLNCASCHSTGADGGCLGPPLAGVGAFRTNGFLQARLTNTKEAEEKFQSEYSYHAELMPHPRFAPDTANKLVAYLLTLPMPQGGFAVAKHANKTTATSTQVAAIKEASTADILEGSKSFYKFGCTACHSIGNVGGSLAPSLDAIGSTKDIDYIKDHITDAQFHSKMIRPYYDEKPSRMPQFKATEKEIDQIAAFLYTLKSKK